MAVCVRLTPNVLGGAVNGAGQRGETAPHLLLLQVQLLLLVNTLLKDLQGLHSVPSLLRVSYVLLLLSRGQMLSHLFGVFTVGNLACVQVGQTLVIR